MKNYIALVAAILLLFSDTYSQSVGINNAAPDTSAALDITSTTKGVLIPRLTQAQRLAIASPAKGLLVFDSTSNSFWYRNGAVWQELGVATNAWKLKGNSGTDTAVNFLGTTDAQPLMFKVNNTRSGYIDWDVASANTGFGYQALYSNTTGGDNTANGYQALYSNTDGYGSTANGYQALYSNTTGGDNTANGYESLYSNTTGYSNTANGAIALVSNTTGHDNTANGEGALFLNITGSYNTANGVAALYSNNESYNTANGFQALYSNTTGFDNTANGFKALYSNTEGTLNTANGHQSLYSNTTGGVNTANGHQSLYSNTTGGGNAANGTQALYHNSTGSYNTANGFSALLYNTTGSYNTANGVLALYGNTESYNTADGYEALYNTTASQYNVALGYHAGYAYDNGYNNVFLGANTDVNGAGYYNVVAIGQATVVTGSSQARIGNAATTSIGGYANWTNISDGRYKKNLKENVKGLDFILKLRPVTYNLNVTYISGKLNESRGQPMNGQMKTAMAEKEKIIQSGFIAQEVEQAAKETGYDFSGVDAPKNENDFYGLRYAEFVVPLVKAVQEQQKQIEELKKNNASLIEQNKQATAAKEQLQLQLQNLMATVSTLNKKVEVLAAHASNTKGIAVTRKN